MIKSYIECDRCGKHADSGITVRVDRIVLGVLGDPINVNEFRDFPNYTFCGECGEQVRAALRVKR